MSLHKEFYDFREKVWKALEDLVHNGCDYLGEFPVKVGETILPPKGLRTITTAFRKKNIIKESKTEKILGCSFEEFKVYIESKFEPWMSWENYGQWEGKIANNLNYSWELDHIIPVNSAKTEEDVIKLNHYTNFQPLCTYKNRWIKSNKILN